MKATEAKATVSSVRVTPRKVRLVINVIRGKSIKEALGILENVNRSASPIVAKLVKSAVANAVKNHEMIADKLYIDTIYANDGTRMKRFMPRAKGSASAILKRTSHITCVVKEK
jgi:large subunit ribosomal protein L22